VELVRRADDPAPGLLGGGRSFSHVVEEASVPAQALTTAPPEIQPPADIAEIVLRHGMELL
jgi:hypothetical protein